MLFLRFVVTLPLFLVAVVLAAPASNPVSKQYNFDLSRNISNCFVSCHALVTASVRLPNRSTNFIFSITENCRYSTWVALVSNCLPTKCISAPDFAYALEYGTHFCKRAGVDVTFIMPPWFRDSPGGKWYNATLLAAASSGQPKLAVPVAPVAVAAFAVSLVAL